jgi:aryl sulfotransferase
VPLRRYTSPDEDSARWEGFPFRQGDVVVSARSKHGTTWVQTILLLLIHQHPELPAPLAELSPWLDHLVETRDEVVARLAAQPHRRVVKTHTPLDGVPLNSRATYIVAVRHPLDAAVSLYHHGNNIDRERVRQLTGGSISSPRSRLSVEEWLLGWIEEHPQPSEALDSLPGVMWHLTDAWSRRKEHNVALVHFDDLLADLEGQMRRLAGVLGIRLPPKVWRELVEAAGLERMRARANWLAPNPGRILLNPRAFFRRGVSGGGAEMLSAAALIRYYERAADLAPPDLLDWLHRLPGKSVGTHER